MSRFASGAAHVTPISACESATAVTRTGGPGGTARATPAEKDATPAPHGARRWAEHVLSAFGENRVIWGSDWPVLELASTYALWFEEAQAVAASLSQAGRAALFGGTARRIYKL